MVTLNADTLVLLEEDTPAVKLYFSGYLLNLIHGGPHAIRLIGPAREGLGDASEPLGEPFIVTAIEFRPEIYFSIVSHALESILADAPGSGVKSFSFVVGGKPLRVDVQRVSCDASESISLRIDDAAASASTAKELALRYAELFQGGRAVLGDHPGEGLNGWVYLCPTSRRKLQRARFLAAIPIHLMRAAWLVWWAALGCAAYQHQGLNGRFGTVGMGASAVVGLVVGLVLAKAIVGFFTAYFRPDRFAVSSETPSLYRTAVWFSVGFVPLLAGVADFGAFVEWAVGPNCSVGSLGWSLKAAAVAAPGILLLFAVVANFTRWLHGTEPIEVKDAYGVEGREGKAGTAG